MKYSNRYLILITFLFSSIVLLQSCATPHKPMTRAQYLNVTQKTYSDVAKKEFFKAAKRLFKLNDNGDYSFSYRENKMIARNKWSQKKWSQYLVIAVLRGTDVWTLNAKTKNNKLKASVNVITSSGDIYGTPTGGGGAQTTSVPPGGYASEGPLIYKLFWARMDYLLGKRNSWPTCEDAKEWRKEPDMWGSTLALCRLGTENNLPESTNKTDSTINENKSGMSKRRGP